MIREILAMVLLSLGLISFVISAIGVFRMKDFYCRLHAAGICESAGLILSAAGLFIYEGLTVTGLKIFLILLAVFLASPIGTHIICKVAYKESLEAEAHAEVQAALGMNLLHENSLHADSSHANSLHTNPGKEEQVCR